MECKICSEEFKDGWRHALSYSDGNFKDLKHELALEEFKNAGYKGNCPFCDGKVRHIGCGIEGWEIICSNCNFLFDED